jgi:hypothetical protein
MRTFDLTADEIVARFKTYLDAFSRQDHDGLKAVLVEDLFFLRGDGMAPWRSRQELLDFHGPDECWKYFRETLRFQDLEFVHLPAPGAEMELCYFIGTLDIHLDVFKDWTDPPFGYPPFRAGETLWMRDRVMYVMNGDGMIVSILWLATEFPEGEPPTAPSPTQ